ncbi:sulfur oxidation c-type cytochrome SoxA [Thiohalomonas denitrificans]|uniref:SoxAX cytochrome complex subunit A n=1 Tax=Thiohalomonas denitrificans TaxID=415747 RepID=A0A1G5PZU3_9GAMM|nr:sulfur oxidation c-type cytochrome SoxA [Thiohalomonas denitrificans]SCZ54947.1 sulfur-oxidizing protein SoxA [Thiohalomonas denitrificans]
MKKLIAAAAALAVVAGSPLVAQASPEEDQKDFQAHYMKRFPGVPLDEYTNGVYAVNEDARSSWEAIEDFPPWDEALVKGEQFFNEKFANGKSYADCFPNGGIGIRQNYPYFDSESGDIKTLEGEINECREANDEKPLKWKKGKLAAISAYMASTSDGKKLDVEVPDDPRALEWYNKGKEFYYTKRGQLNLSCANCHVDNPGMRIRSDTLSPALGHPSHFPVWRMKWAAKDSSDDLGGLGTMHRRFGGCNKQVRAKPFPAQSDEYKALEYFLTYMSNDIPVSASRTRK